MVINGPLESIALDTPNETLYATFSFFLFCTKDLI